MARRRTRTIAASPAEPRDARTAHTLWVRRLVAADLATAVSASARPVPHQTLLLDALFTHARSGGPPANMVGHLDIASGPLRDAGGTRAVGHFAFTCRTTAILGGGDAREHCAGWGETADGRIDFAGPTRLSDATHRWTIVPRSGAYRGARGTPPGPGAAAGGRPVLHRPPRPAAGPWHARREPERPRPAPGRRRHLAARAGGARGGAGRRRRAGPKPPSPPTHRASSRASTTPNGPSAPAPSPRPSSASADACSERSRGVHRRGGPRDAEPLQRRRGRYRLRRLRRWAAAHGSSRCARTRRSRAGPPVPTSASTSDPTLEVPAHLHAGLR